MSQSRCMWLDVCPRGWVPGARPAEKLEELECRDLLEASKTDHGIPHVEILDPDGYCTRCGGIPEDPIHIAGRFATRLRQLFADKWALEVQLKEARDERNLLRFEKMMGQLQAAPTPATQQPLFGAGE